MRWVCWLVLLCGCDCGGTAGPTRDTGMDSFSPFDGDFPDRPSVDTATDGPDEECAMIVATVRDFEASHIDFQDEISNHVEGLVMSTLGAGRKPVYAHGGTKMGGIENSDSFDEWYRTLDGINLEFAVPLPLTPTGGGSFVFDDDHFFPLDGMGFGMSGQDAEGVDRNFHFTTEIHTSFVYEGGETFTFRGDDDLWLFIDDRLAIDLGGVHGALERSVDLDTLGLTAGVRYSMDIFHAERHTVASNFRIETTIACFMDPLI